MKSCAFSEQSWKLVMVCLVNIMESGDGVFSEPS